VTKFLVVPPTCPSNTTAGAVISPVIENVVGLFSFPADADEPDTLPVTLPVKFP
jgi:hypothetical protein